MQQGKAQIVVFNKSGPGSLEVLLFQTNEKRGSFWQNITGSIEKGEAYLEGGLREFHEETGFSLDLISSIHALKAEYNFIDQFKRNVHERCFVVLLKEKQSPTLDPHEHQAYKWVSAAKIKESDYKYISNYEAFMEAKSLW